MSKVKKVVKESANDKFVVLRNGRLVSDLQYETVNDASQELNHWQKIIKKWPDGSKLTVAKFDSKTHY